ncbi:hypothetical protein [Streptantibioticus silvisoli]|uniref:Bacterial transcriptional activator domain-containing protein n=1 Tax=Streptantibioticus silvisoli TaxID=2705255 RepID=A0ABT6W1C6_9ACTN|nr:hypothetical protein [Streptantibioticus silvisoli]MDI5964069.1 hypothetical protein [Streptantibioticus silvisoli]
MPHHPAPRRRIDETAGALVRSLLALAVLALLLVGLPWGLVQFVGWPLPHAVPGWSDIETALLDPMSTLFLLHLLACLLWPAWALFAWHVARSVTDLVHGGPWVRRPNVGPVHALAAALVTAAVVSLLSRPGAASPATAGQPAVGAVAMPPAVTATMALPETPAHHHAAPGTVEVRAPEGGVYDSMWRIAQRSLGHGDRWPQIYRLNHGVTQADGRSLTNPNLIRPGWIFRLPGQQQDVTPPHRPEHRPTHVTLPTQRSSPPPTFPASTPSPAPSAPAATHTARPEPRSTAAPEEPSAPAHRPGIALPSGGYVGIGLAALVTAALVTVRLRRRRAYRPGSRDRDGLTIAPVVRALRIAHDATLNTASAEPEPPAGNAYPPPVAAPMPVPPVPAPVAPSGPVVGERDGRALAWNLATAHGLGLVGPGSLDAARALLTAQLAERMDPSRTQVDVVLPEPDARLLLGDDFTSRPAWLWVPGTLNDALDVLEQELLDRAARQAAASPQTSRQVILLATPIEWADRRLQALLENGAAFGLTAILLGQWRAGTTAHVRPDGTVSVVRPNSELAGARLFTLPEADTRELLELLAAASSTPAGRKAEEPPVFAEPADPAPREPDGRQPSTQQRPAPKALLRRPKTTMTVRTTADPRRPASPTAPPEDLHRLLGALKAPEAPPTASTTVATAPARAMTLHVLGRVQLLHHLDGAETEVDVTSALAPKHREILAYLALNRTGARREALTASIWPDAPRDRPFNSFHATLSQMRKAIRVATENAVTDLTRQDDGTYALDPEQLAVDLWDIEDALRTGRPEQNDAVLQRVLDAYRGDLAPELPVEWLDVPREALRREVLDAVTNRARALRQGSPGRALVLFEHARTLDRYNEAVYCEIAEVQDELGQIDAIARTYGLLVSALAELDDEPAPETVALIEGLGKRSRNWRVTEPKESA